MFARTSTWSGSAEALERWAEHVVGQVQPFVAGLPGNAGGMFLIDEAQQRDIVARVYTDLVNTEPGGSGANTMIGLGQLGGTGCYTSRVGPDDHGAMYREQLAARGIKPNLAVGTGDTGICLVLVSPDAQRTRGP